MKHMLGNQRSSNSEDFSNDAPKPMARRHPATPEQDSGDEPVLRKPMYTARLTRSDKRLWMEISEWRKYLRSLPDPMNELHKASAVQRYPGTAVQTRCNGQPKPGPARIAIGMSFR
jgi:hypothetical protein